MRRVAILLHGGIGGGHFSQGQPSIHQLVHRLAEHFEIDVYSASPPGDAFVSSTFEIYSLRGRKYANFIRWAFLVGKFLSLTVKKRYHLVYAFWGYPAGSLAVILGKLLRIPSVVHLQGGDAARVPSFHYGVFCNALRARVCRRTYKMCTELIVLTEYQAKCLRANGVVRQPTVIPYGPDLKRFPFRPRTFDNSVVRFIHVGNQTPIKGQETMIGIFSYVANRMPSTLVIVGEDNNDGMLRERCRSLGIDDRVEFFGPQPHTRMPEFYREADVLLHTPWYEGQGLVFAEAAACGTVIAGTSVGMLSDMGEECAIISEAGDVELFGAKIVRVLSDKARLSTMQTSARSWVEKKDVNYTERRIVEMLQKLLYRGDSEKSQNIER